MGKFVSKSAVLGLLCVFILALTVGGVLSADMMMPDDGAMQNCPYMGIAVLCNMTPLQHLSEWQVAFAATAQQLSIAALLLMLAALLLWRLILHLLAPPPSILPTVRYRDRQVIFNPLRLAFARGLIHPKVF
jgi:hypothetical protein